MCLQKPGVSIIPTFSSTLSNSMLYIFTPLVLLSALTRPRVFEIGVVELAKLLGCFVEPQFLDRFTVTEQVEKRCFSRPSFPNQKHLVWRCHDRSPALQNNCRKKFQAVKCEFTISLQHFYAAVPYCKRPKAGRGLRTQLRTREVGC